MCLTVYGCCPGCTYISDHEEFYPCLRAGSAGCPGVKDFHRSLFQRELSAFHCTTKGCPLNLAVHKTKTKQLREAVYSMRAEYDGEDAAHTKDFKHPILSNEGPGSP